MGIITTNWFAVYIRSNYEKKVHSLLVKQSIEAYLPLQKRLHKWSDRKKWIEEPLIRSYVFVNISEREYFNVLNTPGVIRYVTFSGKAAAIPLNQIETIKRILAVETELEITNEVLHPGDPVEITAGRLLGLKGELIEYRGAKRVIIRIEQLNHSILLTVPVTLIKSSYHSSRVA